MGANDGFTPDNQGTEKEQVPTPPGQIYTEPYKTPEQIRIMMRESEQRARDKDKNELARIRDFGEPHLTHHQQAVKDFMVAIVASSEDGSAWTSEQCELAAGWSSKLADAFINQINKK